MPAPPSPEPPSPAPPPPEPSLHVEDLDVTYGRTVSALRAVSLTVPAHGIVALLGANGAGKTTLLRALSGTLRHHRGAVTGGRIRYGGTVLDGRDPVAAVRAGVVHVPEGRRVFAGLTVEENLRAGALGPGRRTPPRGARPATASSASSPGWPNAADNPPACSPAASSRCSPSAAP